MNVNMGKIDKMGGLELRKEWNSLEEVFDTLNNTVNYVVLRNFEKLPHHVDSPIDILTDDRDRLLRILKPSGSGFFQSRKHVEISIAGQPINWNIRYAGDGSYCLPWEQDMLKDRVFHSGNLYVLNDEHHFYSFIYSVFVHEEKAVKEHYAQAERLLQRLSPTETAQISVDEKDWYSDIFDYYFELLNSYMQRKNYTFGNSLRGRIYNQYVAMTPQIARRLEKKFGITDTKPLPLRSLNPFQLRVLTFPFATGIKRQNQQYRRTFYRAWLNDRKAFIKHGGRKNDSVEQEFSLCNRLHEVNEHNFPQIYFYSEDTAYRCVAYEFLEGKTLSSKIKRADFSASEKQDYIVQIRDIAQALIATGIVHRDIHTENIIITREGKLKLIDFGLAVDGSSHEKCRVFRKNPLFRFECSACVENVDISGLLKVVEAIGCQESYQDVYRDVESFLREYCEKTVSTCKGKRFLFLAQSLKKVHRIIKQAWNRLRQQVSR